MLEIIASVAIIIFLVVFIALCVGIVVEFSRLMDAWERSERAKNIHQLRKDIGDENFIKFMKGGKKNE